VNLLTLTIEAGIERWRTVGGDPDTDRCLAIEY
jgi:hypothetical protein